MNEVASLPRRINIINATLLTDLSVIALLWCISIVIVNPVGDFPIIVALLIVFALLLALRF